MAEPSILTSVKKMLGIDKAYTAFDIDIITHINSVLATLTQVGIGPVTGFLVEDDTDTWDALLGADPRFNIAKTYVYLRVRLLFDPPATSFAIDAINQQIREFEFRLAFIADNGLLPAVPVGFGVSLFGASSFGA